MDNEEFEDNLREMAKGNREVLRATLGIERLNEIAKEFYEGIAAEHERRLKECEEKVDRFLAEEKRQSQ